MKMRRLRKTTYGSQCSGCYLLLGTALRIWI